MISALLIFAFLAAGYALLMSIGVTVVFIVLLIKLKKAGAFAKSEEEKAAEDDKIGELVRINFDIVRDLEESEARNQELLGKLDETNKKLEVLIEERKSKLVRDTQENSNKVADLALKLTAVTEQNKELAVSLCELKAEKQNDGSPAQQDGASAKKIKELEELVSYKDNFYAQTAAAEKKLRAGVCDAIESLLRTKGSDSTEYFEEQIAAVIKILDESRTRSR